MKDETISMVYARALLELAEEKRELGQVLEEVLYLEKILQTIAKLRAFVESPKLERSAKRKAIESAFRGKLSDITVNFLLLVIDKGRQLYLLRMLRDFKALHDEKIGLVHASAATAVPLSHGSREALRLGLEQKLGKRIDLENIVDPELLGGLIIRYDGMAADGSLRTELKRITGRMLDVKFGSEFVHEN